jgi:hypothetical protein
LSPADVVLIAACSATLALTSRERAPDRDAPAAVGIILGSIAVGLAARAARNAGLVETQSIYLLNPVMDALIALWAFARHRAKPRDWTRLLILVSVGSIFASAAYGAAAKTPEARYLYASVLNALLITGLCGIGYGGLRDVASSLVAELRSRALARLPGRAR